MPAGKETVISGNTKTGRLISVGPNTFIGERIGPKRTMESKRFYCKRTEIYQLWQAWRDEAKQEAFITTKKPAKQERKQERKEQPQMPTPQAKTPENVYLLSFKDQRTTKPLVAYLDMGEAISMQDAMTLVLDVQGLEGEYTVDELPVWPRKEK